MATLVGKLVSRLLQRPGDTSEEALPGLLSWEQSFSLLNLWNVPSASPCLSSIPCPHARIHISGAALYGQLVCPVALGEGQQSGRPSQALPLSPFPQLQCAFLESWCGHHSLKHLITCKDLAGCLSPPGATFLFWTPSEANSLGSNEIELKMR